MKILKAERVVIRTPFYPFDPTNQWSAFNEAIQTPAFKEALFLASPSLYNEFIKSGETISEETLLSLYKYFLRMSFRCTPFGMFSGVSAGTIGTSTSYNLKSQNEYSKHTRLDNHFLNSFIQKIAKDEGLRNEISWFPNNTIYSDGSHIRYVEYRLTASQRSHHLAKVEQSEYLEKILVTASGGATLDNLIKAIQSEEISEEDAKGFIDQLIESKLLLSELEPMVTGGEPGIRLLSILNRYESGRPHATFLKVLIDAIQEIDDQGTGADLSLHQKVVDCISEWDSEYDPKLIFQSDLNKPVESIQINEEILIELKKTLSFLGRLNEPLAHPNLKLFKEEFSKRYEDAEVPLLAVLDTESGIGYPVNAHSSNDQSPLLQGLAFPRHSNNSEHKLASWQRRLIRLYQQCLQEGKSEITLTGDTFSLKDTFDENALADSLFTICSILGSQDDVANGNFLIDFRGSSGPSAANLLGRFCYANIDVNNIVTELIQQEEQLHPEKIYAEIVHLAQARVGNVLLRPSFRKYEIPILTFSGVDDEHTISLDDLMVSVRQGKVILRSKKFDKEVLPRNTNAHNYSNDTIPHYHFLCDLQNQEMNFRLNWDWGVLNEFKFLPRIKYGKTVLSKARWILEEKDLKLSAKCTDSEFKTTLNQFASSNKLPESVVLSQGDNQLPLNLNDEMCIKILRQELKRNKMVTLEESLFREETLTVQSPEGKFTNEFIIPWTKTDALKFMQRMIQSKSNVPQNFIPGTEWHYIKIYCGSKTSDKILTEVIKPMADHLLDEKIISQWFFIRYGDPDHHLRVRFKGYGNFFQEVTKTLNEKLNHYLQNGHVWKIQADTYKRELDRYGYENIEASESLFFYDSVATSEILQLLEGDEGDSFRWQFAIKGVNELLNDFGYSLKQKEELVTQFRDGFAREFNATSRESQKKLSDHYRNFRKQIELALQPEISTDHDFAPIWKIFTRRSELLIPVIKEIKEYSHENINIKLADLIGSYIHMFVNRFMLSNQRMHEMVIYDFLCQYYKSEIARQKKSAKSNQELADLPVPL